MPLLQALSWTDVLESPWTKIAVTALGALVGAFVVGFVIRGGAVMLWRDLSSTALFRLRVLGGIIGGILTYWLVGLPGFGPGPGGEPGRPGDERARLQPEDETKDKEPRPGRSKDDQPPTADRKLRVRLVTLAEHDKAGQPKNRFFAFPDKPSELLTVEAVMERIDRQIASGQLRSDALIEVIYADDSPDPEFNPLVKLLQQKVKEKGLNFDTTHEKDLKSS